MAGLVFGGAHAWAPVSVEENRNGLLTCSVLFKNLMLNNMIAKLPVSFIRLKLRVIISAS